jgi:hypothetical protein
LSPYYYTTAALPTIRLGEKILIKEEQFLEFAEDTLKAGDYQILLKSRLGSTEPTGFVFADRILSWETELRLELAKARLAKLKHDPPPCLPESNGRDVLVEKARTAVAMDSPLEAECFLNQLRWSFIEEMGVSHFFDLEALVVYYFKLQIALRQENFRRNWDKRLLKRHTMP